MVIQELDDGWGSALGFAPDGSAWAATTTGSLHLRIGDELRSVEIGGFVAGAPRFVDGAVLAGTWRVPFDGGEPARAVDLAEALVADLDPGARPRPQQFPAQLVEWSAGGDRVAALGRFTPSREVGAVDEYAGPGARVVLADADGAQLAVLEHDTGPLTDRVAAFGGDLVVVGAGGASAFDAASGAPVGEPLAPAKGRALGIAVSHGGVVALTRTQGEAVAWAPRSDDAREWQAHEGAGRAAAWHAGGTLATGGDDHKVVLWDLDGEPSPRATIEVPGEVYGLAFHPVEPHLYVAHQFPEQGISVFDVAEHLG